MHEQGGWVTARPTLGTNTKLTKLMKQGYVICETDYMKARQNPVEMSN